jgi:hypothetical protein
VSASVIDEGVHAPVTADPLWQESVVLAWWDPRAGLAGQHRIGREPNAGPGATALWSGLFRADGSLFRANEADLPLVDSPHNGFLAGHQHMFHDGQSLRFESDQPGFAMDLAVTDIEGTFIDFDKSTNAPAESYNAADGSGEAEYFSYHVESEVRVRGTVEFDGSPHEIDGFGWRDHSWGVRHWDDILAVRFFAGGDGTAANAYVFLSATTRAGTLRRMGKLRVDGVQLDVESARSVYHLDDDWAAVPEAEFVYTLRDGTQHRLRYETFGGYVAQTRHVAFETVGRVSLDGREVGWALCESVNNPRASPNPPAFVLADRMTNGLSIGARER